MTTLTILIVLLVIALAGAITCAYLAYQIGDPDKNASAGAFAILCVICIVIACMLSGLILQTSAQIDGVTFP